MKKVNFINQKTVYNGSSMSEFNRVRNILELYDIEYKYKTVDLGHNSYLGSQGVARSKGGNFGNVNSSMLYEVLVRKDNYDEAMGIISKRINHR
ncbi:MAG: hypothetical protein Q4D16_05910 [Eubacteriales bacterium]|nr:hypothetical protein [Eubacteriales bacterium]